ncbi:hypothetical protein GUJ93_ZPchr0011g28143 [Zizania palustris]|uniref:Uncharacterized protein n=1 Tax=Zizania palustris TaxID=103762 RepID=A0A8J5WLY3_ZIZPA|nr:hypothetical protein GUJ93_ZPchr0011g28143 [Zizania palustris]
MMIPVSVVLLFRVRKLSEITEKISQSLLDTVISVTGSMAASRLAFSRRSSTTLVATPTVHVDLAGRVIDNLARS